MFKKRVALLLVAIMTIVAALSGCTSGAGNSSSSSNNSGNSGQKTIVFWYPYSDKISVNAINKIIKGFEKENPGIKVKGQYIGSSGGSGNGITDKLMSAIAGGNPPDVVAFDRFQVGQWASKNSLTDLTELAKKDGIKSSDYYKFAWDEANYNGKLYALPYDADTRALYYNKDMFKAAGLDPNKPPKTIAELEQYAKKLTVKNGNRYQTLGFIPWAGEGWLYTWGWVFGGQFQDPSTGKITANDPKIVQALQWEKDFAKQYGGMDNMNTFNTTRGGTLDPFMSKQVAMIITGNWEIAALKQYAPDLHYGITPVPTPTGNNFTTWSGGFSMVIPKGAKNVNEAWKFAKYFSTGQGSEIWNKETAHFSPIKAINDKIYANDPQMKLFVDLLPNSHNRPVISQSQLLWDELVKAPDKVMHNQGTPKQVLTDITNKVNQAIGK